MINLGGVATASSDEQGASPIIGGIPPDLPTDELVDRAIGSEEIRSAALEATLNDEELRAAVEIDSLWGVVEPELTRLQAAESNLGYIREEIEQQTKVGSIPARVDVFGVHLEFEFRVPMTRGQRWRAEQRRREQLEVVYGLEVARTEADQARLALLEALYERGILATLRRFIESSAAASWSTVLTIDKAPGLAEIAGVAPVATEMVDEIAARLALMPGGSVGISGPRGVGKTTLMRLFTRSRRDPLLVGVRVSAPTKYDGREFVLHLFGRLCDEVQRISGEPLRATGGSRSEQVGWRSRWLDLALATVPAGLAVVGLGLGLAGALHGTIDSRFLAGLACLAASAALLVRAREERQEQRAASSGRADGSLPRVRSAVRRRRLLTATALSLVAGGGLVAISQLDARTPAWFWAALILSIAYLLQISEFPIRRLVSIGEEREGDSDVTFPGLVAQAGELARGIRFQQTVATGWSVTAKAPVAEGAITGSRSLQEIPLSFPQVTDTFMQFIESLAKYAQIRIGIDELDKMAADETPRFLNDIKAVFGVRECFFLVSVSEEAMSNFARRDARLRDVFDSSFDDIVNMRLLSLPDSRRIMADRVARLPRPFLALCHALSGGLARDLIREARAIFSLKQQGVDARLSEVTHAIFARELDIRRHAAAVAVRALNLEPHVSRFLHWLTTLTVSSDDLEAACATAEPWNMDARVPMDAQSAEDLARLIMLTREFQGFAYFSATALRFFVDSLGRDSLESIAPAQLGGSVDDLAAARHEYGINLAAASERTTAFRRAWDMPAIDPAVSRQES